MRILTQLPRRKFWYFLLFKIMNALIHLPGRVAQSVTCLAKDAKLTADPGVASSIPARSHTFVEIGHEIISPPFRWIIHEGLLSVTRRKYVHELLVTRLFKLAQEKSVVRWTDRPAMTIAVDLGRKATKQTNKALIHSDIISPFNGSANYHLFEISKNTLLL